MLYRKQSQFSLLNAENKEQVKATVIFSQSTLHKWLHWFLKDGFSHVKVVVHHPDVNIVIDPRSAYTTLDVYSRFGILVQQDGEMHVKVTRLIDRGKIRRFFGPINCVETVKGVLGIKNPFILTPYQLYKELKNGKP